jgi:hypothetical protein
MKIGNDLHYAFLLGNPASPTITEIDERVMRTMGTYEHYEININVHLVVFETLPSHRIQRIIRESG